jgi:phage shock protein A
MVDAKAAGLSQALAEANEHISQLQMELERVRSEMHILTGQLEGQKVLLEQKDKRLNALTAELERERENARLARANGVTGIDTVGSVREALTKELATAKAEIAQMVFAMQNRLLGMCFFFWIGGLIPFLFRFKVTLDLGLHAGLSVKCGLMGITILALL